MSVSLRVANAHNQGKEKCLSGRPGISTSPMLMIMRTKAPLLGFSGVVMAFEIIE